MTTPTNQFPTLPPSEAHAQAQADALIGLVLDASASDGQWRQFTALASGRPEFWERLARDAHAHLMLARALDEAGDAIAPSLPHPSPLPVPDSLPLSPAVRARAPRGARSGSTGSSGAARSAGVAGAIRGAGWLAAACLALAWAVSHLVLLDQRRNDTSLAHAPIGDIAPQGSIIVNTADDALDAYRTLSGRAGVDVDAPSDLVILQAFPALDGTSIEVVAVRQIIERRILDDLYRVGHDDSGLAALVALRPEQLLDQTQPGAVVNDPPNSEPDVVSRPQPQPQPQPQPNSPSPPNPQPEQPGLF